MLILYLQAKGHIDLLKKNKKITAQELDELDRLKTITKVLDFSQLRKQNQDLNDSKLTAKIEENDSFFGADEWRRYDNPNDEMDYQKFTLAKGPSYPSVIGSVIDPIGAVGMDAIDKILGNTEPIHSRSRSRDVNPAVKHKQE